MVNLRRRITSSEAAKQEAEPQSNKRRTRLPRVQVQEVRSLATFLTAKEKEKTIVNHPLSEKEVGSDNVDEDNTCDGVTRLTWQ